MCTKTAVPTMLCKRANVKDGPEKRDDRIKIDKNSKSVIKRHMSQPPNKPAEKKLGKTDCYRSISSPFVEMSQTRLQTNID